MISAFPLHKYVPKSRRIVECRSQAFVFDSAMKSTVATTLFPGVSPLRDGTQPQHSASFIAHLVERGASTSRQKEGTY